MHLCRNIQVLRCSFGLGLKKWFDLFFSFTDFTEMFSKIWYVKMLSVEMKGGFRKLLLGS